MADQLNLHPSSEGINLVKVRGEAMQAASEMTDSGMMTVFIGADQKLNFGCDVAREWCHRHRDIEQPVCQVCVDVLFLLTDINRWRIIYIVEQKLLAATSLLLSSLRRTRQTSKSGELNASLSLEHSTPLLWHQLLKCLVRRWLRQGWLQLVEDIQITLLYPGSQTHEFQFTPM